MKKRDREPKKTYSVGYLTITNYGKDENAVNSHSQSNVRHSINENKYLGSLEHLEVVRKAREQGKLTPAENAAKHILENFEIYFDYACKNREPGILFSIFLVCIKGFIDAFIFEEKSIIYTALYKQSDELLNLCLRTIDKEISSYQKVINSVIANDFLEELYAFREQMENLIAEAKKVTLDTSKLQDNTNISSILLLPPESTKLKSYVWLGKLEELVTFYSLLIEAGFLPDSTDLENFKALFSGKPLNTIEPLQWLKNKNQLAYLIDQLFDNGKFPDDTNYWSIAEACFIDIKNLKQQRINYQNNKQGKPKGYSKIDAILKRFTNTLPVNLQ